MVRIKERYLLVNIIYPPDVPNPGSAPGSTVPSLVSQHRPTTDKLTHQTLLKAIRAQVATLFGEYGSGALDGSLWIKYLSLATSTFIVRCPRGYYQMLWAALTFMDHVPTKEGPGSRCIFRVVRVSGTIRKAEEEAIRQARLHILAAQEEAEQRMQVGSTVLASATDKDDVTTFNVVDDDDDDDEEPMHDAEG